MVIHNFFISPITVKGILRVVHDERYRKAVKWVIHKQQKYKYFEYTE